jgi:hypothetical protein
MSAENLRTGSVRPDDTRDPRVRLVREKYFSLRPRPLERWLWGQGIPTSAERVFWLHWQEGMKRGDWCSELPIRRVAAECQLDVSTVTRAYQWLVKAGCLRRTDPGRDPANPFHQATAVTEVRVPRELLVEFDRHPNRRTKRAGDSDGSTPPTAPETSAFAVPDAVPAVVDPFAGLSGRDRLRAWSSLTRAMSAEERREYDEARRLHRPHMGFDAKSALTADERGKVLQQLSVLAAAPKRPATTTPTVPGHPAPARSRQLTVFELARLRRDVQAATSSTAAPDLVRQVAWSVEEGALRRFPPQHAVHIALKKIRDGAWTRPNRMPPNWSRG